HCQVLLFVGMFYGQATSEDLKKDFPEVLGGNVVQEWIHYRTKIKEDVCYGEENDICPEIRDCPVLLGPTYCQCCNNQTCKEGEEKSNL
uniref:Uncharacterized protein n=1 Tax=Laticauda laticaudata TaxID=8630 RepID=A0A8C5RP03_LATLA